MLIYQGTTAKFVLDMDEQTVVDQLLAGFKLHGLPPPSGSELQSWRHSLMYMGTLLNHKDIPEETGVAIEYRIPGSGHRVDFILTGFKDSGKSAKGLEHSAVIIELKQWQSLEMASNLNDVVRVRTFIGGAIRERPHPSYQAWSYAQLIEQFNEAVEAKQIALHPCAFLHNYRKAANDPLTDPRYADCLERSPTFCHGEIPRLRSFICQHITHPDQGLVLDEIESGRIRPAKSLQDALSQLLQGNPEYVMIDDQKVVFEHALSLARAARDTGRKKVLVVRGGPGTGKSVVAINLLVQLTHENLLTKYVSKNSAPRNVYSNRLIAGDFKKSYINHLFCGSGNFINAKSNSYGALVVDEAHRLNEKSGLFGNLGHNQTQELISSALFSVFFIDESQRVTLKDAGSIMEIQKWAEAAGAEMTILELTSQFRCNGSREYLEWLDDILGVPAAVPPETPIRAMDYEFKVFDDPNELAAAIAARNEPENKARLVAGYCWNWATAGKNNPTHKDIQLPEHAFARSWNLNNTTTWAIDPKSVEEIGCIHTCQGLEFDFVGVIMGDDLRFEGGKVITDASRRARTDQSLKGLKKLAKTAPAEAQALADEIIRNTYRVLMTRGQRGCYVYCTDRALREYLKERLAEVGSGNIPLSDPVGAGSSMEA